MSTTKLSGSALRSRTLKKATAAGEGAGTGNTRKPVLYWMSRDQRVSDNWALLHAQHLAGVAAAPASSSSGSSSPSAASPPAPLAVAFCLAPAFLGATIRQFGFMLKGLREVEERLKGLNIPFILLRGDVTKELPKYASAVGCGTIVTDFNPLKIKRIWNEGVMAAVGGACAVVEVDAHNIVPCWEASNKLEFAAKTMRPKLNDVMGRYLTDIPAPLAMPAGNVAAFGGGGQWLGLTELSSTKTSAYTAIDWGALHESVAAGVDTAVGEVDWCKPGEVAASEALRTFLSSGKMQRYAAERNNPVLDGQSNLSPYFHFGHLSPQRAAFESLKGPPTCLGGGHGEGPSAFREELIIRRELADNLCYYNPHYDTFDGLQTWAKTTLMEHAKDKREYTYTRAQFEGGETHDVLWNAAQAEARQRGKMHGFIRMYWAKKILEWSATPQEALANAIYLNDKYFLDGRDPNGYAGVTWSIGGTHDWGWTERDVFGKVRFMNFAGCKRKFDVAAYCKTWLGPSAVLDLKKGSSNGLGPKKTAKEGKKASSSAASAGTQCTLKLTDLCVSKEATATAAKTNIAATTRRSTSKAETPKRTHSSSSSKPVEEVKEKVGKKRGRSDEGVHQVHLVD